MSLGVTKFGNLKIITHIELVTSAGWRDVAGPDCRHEGTQQNL